MNLIGVVAGVVGLVAMGAMIEGYVLSVLWRWFFVPLGAPILSIPSAIGVTLVIGMMTHQTQKGEADKDWWAGLFVKAFIAPWLILVIGWVVRQFL